MNTNIRGKGPKKRKARDDKILAKAKKVMTPNINDVDEDDTDHGEPLPYVTDEEMARMLNPDPDPAAPPPKKLRKPRHTEKKPKPDDTEQVTPGSPEKTKKKKKKKKKSKSAATTPLSKSAESSDRYKKAALNFLQTWKHCKSEWRFEKLRQSWLLQNCLNPDLVPDTSFPILLEYMASVRGSARTKTEKEMEVAMKAFEITQNPSDGATLRYERARQILQMLSSE